jgi:hypothetical protein
LSDGKIRTAIDTGCGVRGRTFFVQVYTCGVAHAFVVVATGC